ncbi:MAG: WYL domain-containing protein [Chloroflexaceae bacterium]|jgi:predicted DNA-binding transcriptional regulator YafY|nr:WYL domain-containing protein [Chloroflexaceae bacterium]
MNNPPLPAPDSSHIARLQALVAALRAGPLTRMALLEKLGAEYPDGDSGRRMVERDIKTLGHMGICIKKIAGRPLSYSLLGGVPNYSNEELAILALIRDSFDARHPQAQAVHALLCRLTEQLDAAQLAYYNRRQARRAPLQPAIDYSPYADVIARLEHALNVREVLSFDYRPSRGGVTTHSWVEPYEIEFYERHFYLVAYTSKSGQMHDFRIDRIQEIKSVQRLPPHHVRQRGYVRFRYRLAAELARGEISQRFEEQQVVERLPNGDVIIEAEGRNEFFIVQMLLRYRNKAELLWPESLRQQMGAVVTQLAELYRD